MHHAGGEETKKAGEAVRQQKQAAGKNDQKFRRPARKGKQPQKAGRVWYPKHRPGTQKTGGSTWIGNLLSRNRQGPSSLTPSRATDHEQAEKTSRAGAAGPRSTRIVRKGATELAITAEKRSRLAQKVPRVFLLGIQRAGKKRHCAREEKVPNSPAAVSTDNKDASS